MSSNQNTSGKQPRNQKNQKDKKKKENEGETSKPSKSESSTVGIKEVKHEGLAPQPQRSNRRQRPNDQTTNNTGNTTPSVPQERKEKIESVVDHSNLKRETEEIAKLSKKFSKREITSNWHRYSAMEGTAETHPEEDAPADFSDLLQVPVSRGGHLLLREEQEWSAVSGSELGGYFALDLKVLGQGLACQPLHEQLRLPKHMLTEEEINNFNSLAEHHKKCYNIDKLEDPNANVFQQSTNLIRREESLEQRSSLPMNNENDFKDCFNILDVKKSTNRENIGLESKSTLTTQLHMSDITESTKSIDTIHTEQNLTQNSVLQEENSENSNKSHKIVQLNKTQIIETGKFAVEKKSTEPVCYENPEIPSSFTENIGEKGCKKSDRIVFEKSVSPEIRLEISPSIEKLDKFTPNEMNSKNDHLNGNIFNQPEDKSLKKNNTIRESLVETSKITKKIQDVSLEDDDDDLDYLLSLKKPENPETRKELESAAIKDTSFIPGVAAVTEAATQEKHSELDDWLDSVLED